MMLLFFLTIARVLVSILNHDFQSLFNKLVDTQLALVLIPVILFYLTSQSFNLKQILKVYIFGTAVSSIVVVAYFYLYRFNILVEPTPFIFPAGKQIQNFTDDILIFQEFITPYFKHRAAMCVNLSMSIAGLFFLFKQAHHSTIWNKIGGILVGLFFLIVLYATGSRSGYISCFVILVFGLVYLFSRRKRILSIAFFSVLAILIALSSLKTTRPLMINEIKTRNYTELRTKDPRFQIWEICIETIRKHPVIGIGYSQIKKELFQKYKERGLDVDLKEKYNSHNQFFQFAMESGVWASIIFALILLPVYFGRNIFLSISFSATYTIYSLLEDAFLTINGVSIFIFFMALLILSGKKKIKAIEQ
jgi:hypothetical protein